MSRRFRGGCNCCENECQGVALKFSQQDVPILRTVHYPSDLRGFHIRDRNNQHHVLLQCYACKCVRLEREERDLQNLWNYCSILLKCSRNDLCAAGNNSYKFLPTSICVGGMNIT